MSPILKTLPIHLDNKRRNHGRAVEYGPVRSRRSGPGGMACPECGAAKTQTIDSRPVSDGTYRRRRVCASCSFRFTTYELYRPDFVPDYAI